jgi:hypothetical protein
MSPEQYSEDTGIPLYEVYRMLNSVELNGRRFLDYKWYIQIVKEVNDNEK